jgi:hypothetical protein
MKDGTCVKVAGKHVSPKVQKCAEELEKLGVAVPEK